MTEIQEIEIRKGVYAADLNISKEQWLELLQDNTIVGNSMPTLLRFYRAAEHKGTCKDVNPDSPYSENNLFWQFGRRVGNKLNIKVIKSDGNQNYWTIPAKEGRSLSNGFEWTLRDELVDAIRDWLILDLLKRYKGKFLNVSLEDADELYKWQLITTCDNKSTLEIIQNFKSTNLVDNNQGRTYTVLTNLLNDNPQQLDSVFSILKDESVTLENRLSAFKKAMNVLVDEKYKAKADDERTAATFLTCWNPHKYTIYKNEFYKNYCEYIGENTKSAGEKYTHFLNILEPLVQAIKQDRELTVKYATETNGLIQSDLLIAQNILWQMKDLMKTSGNKKYYYAGFSFGGSNSQLDRFIKDGVWEGAGTKVVNDLIQKIKPNDILILKTSSTKGEKHDLPFIRIYAVGVVKSTPKQLENSEHFICDVCYTKMETTDFDGNKYGKYRQTMHECNDSEVIDFVNNIIDQNMIPEEIRQYTKLLKLKQNIILQGAPGTGKTYNTAALALSICGVPIPESHDEVMQRYDDLQKEGRIGFCTFHQSMDYEDFVEGVKPIKPEEGEMYYKVEDGIFKKMSRVATNPQQVKQAKTLDSAFDDLIQDIIDGNVKNLPMKNGSSSADLSVSSQMTIKWKTGNGNIDVNCVSKDRLLKLCEVYDSAEKIGAIANINESIRNVIGGCNSSYYWAVANYILKKIDKGTVSDEKPQNYVLIIDEINRGNVSRIFGELITLLEKDKRLGSEHPIKVTLPYSKESFGVPENLYIIGTMNTTDRSVGNIDYAVRRRFAFATLQSKRDLVVAHSTEQAAVLFDTVKSFIEKNKTEMDFEDLMVGHSYFFAKNDEELALRWQYEILPLLNEYIKDDILRADRLESDMLVEKFVEKWRAESDAKSETDE